MNVTDISVQKAVDTVIGNEPMVAFAVLVIVVLLFVIRHLWTRMVEQGKELLSALLKSVQVIEALNGTIAALTKQIEELKHAISKLEDKFNARKD